MANFEAIKNNVSLSNNEKESNIIESLRLIKDIDQLKKDNLEDVKDRAQLTTVIKNYIQDGENSLLWFLLPQELLNSTTDIIVWKIWKLFDETTNWALDNFSDFINKNTSEILGIFNNDLNHEELQLRHFVDTVYSSGYTFDYIDSNYVVFDTNNTKVDLWTQLDVINWNWNIKGTKEILDDILLERSFTGQWRNLQEMVEIFNEIWINPEHHNQIENVTPELLGEAYLKYYSKKLNYTSNIDLNDKTSINSFLSNPNIKWKIPVERETYIKLMINGQFDQQEKTDDTLVFKKIMKEFDSITKWTGKDLDAFKRVGNWTEDLLNGWIEGVTKYMNGMEWLVLAGAALWALFFSDFKKEAWIGIAWFAWLNVLTKAYNQDPEKWILQAVADWIEWVSQYNIQLPDSLKNIDKALNIQDSKKINSISALSIMPMEDILENTTEKDGIYSFNDITKIPEKQRQILVQLWWEAKYKSAINDVLADVFIKLRENNETFDQTKTRLTSKYVDNNYNASFSLVLATELLKETQNNSTVTQAPNQVNNGNSSSLNTQWNLTNNISSKPSNQEMIEYTNILNWYTGNPNKNILLTTLKNNSKSFSINQLENLRSNDPAITNLITKLQQL